YAHDVCHRVALPTYPFRRERFWIETPGPTAPDWSSLPPQDIAQVLQQMQASGDFSADELKLAPKLLRFLAQQGHREVDDAGVDETLFEVQWQPVPRAARAAADNMPAPERLRAALAPGIGEATPAPHLWRALEALSLAYVLEAMRRMGMEFHPGQQLVSAALQERLGVASQQQRLLQHLLGMLTEEGVLLQTTDGWQVTHTPAVTDPHAQYRTLVEQYPEAEAELTLLGRCGSHLSEVLRGTCDPVQLLFPQADVATATRLYQDSPTFGGMNAWMQRVVSGLVREVPADQHLSILEIGAGTGGTTAHLLPHLPAPQTSAATRPTTSSRATRCRPPPACSTWASSVWT